MLVHQVVDHAPSGFGQVGIEVAGAPCIFHIAYHHYLFLIRRQKESRDAAGVLGCLHAVGSVGIHSPHLRVSVCIGVEECYASSAVEPHGAIFAFRRVGDTRGGRFASDSYCVEVVVGVVFSEILVGHAEEHCFAVGSHTGSADAAESFERFDVEHASAGSGGATRHKQCACCHC